MNYTAEEHEDGLVRGFFHKSKQVRFHEALASPKKRKKLRSQLAHFALDKQFAHVVPANVAHTAEEWARLLKSKGAPDVCWVVSDDVLLDASQQDLSDVLAKVNGSWKATFLSCVPGKLGYFENEDGRWLLQR